MIYLRGCRFNTRRTYALKPMTWRWSVKARANSNRQLNLSRRWGVDNKTELNNKIIRRHAYQAQDEQQRITERNRRNTNLSAAKSTSVSESFKHLKYKSDTKGKDEGLPIIRIPVPRRVLNYGRSSSRVTSCTDSRASL